MGRVSLVGLKEWFWPGQLGISPLASDPLRTLAQASPTAVGRQSDGHLSDCKIGSTPVCLKDSLAVV